MTSSFEYNRGVLSDTLQRHTSLSHEQSIKHRLCSMLKAARAGSQF